jgi:Flp pilus assembly protein TadD
MTTTLHMSVVPCIAMSVLLMNGCGQRASSPYQSASSSERNSIKAQELTRQAAEVLVEDPERAEKLLRQALAADLFYGPAHNDLGVIWLGRGKLYEAASEFEWARQLMPGHPDPRLNLGLTLERAGRIEEAMCSYSAALEVYPGHLPTMQAMARLQLRHNRADDQTKRILEEIALSGESAQWRQWAQKQLIRLESKSSL